MVKTKTKKGYKIQIKGYEKEFEHFPSQNQVNKKDSDARNKGQTSYKATEHQQQNDRNKFLTNQHLLSM